MEYIKFLIEKARCYSLSTIVRLELESLVMGLLSVVPTILGVALRASASKLFFKQIDGFAWIQPRVTIIHAERIVSGTHLGINSGTYINGVGGIQFGNHVLIGNNVTISSGEHPINGAQPPIFSRLVRPKKIVINDDVWIGAGAVIMPGITLAKGTVIGANAIVTKDTEEYSVYVGVPARKIKDRRDMACKQDLA
ncbi:MAG: acyltransferase [Methylobacter sp.]|uniref:acyltransferase n=1 Tax=Methylobacter sp. TaxID=2051955 RepID=UPI00272EF2E3|nr:acyltransferase [Methylobacter sp.]MDP1665891.1 acyltransferase [Methylobacter sp.]